MFLTAFLLAVVVALLRGGSPARVLAVTLRQGWLVPAAFALRFMLARAGTWDGAPSLLSPVVQALSYGALLAAVYLNRTLPGLPTLGTGVALNALVILANGGRMPVDGGVLAAMGHDGQAGLLAAGSSLTHQILTHQTLLPWLADIWPLPHPFPLPSVFSAGDVLIVVGGFVLIQHLFLSPARPAPGAGPSLRRS